MHAQSHRTPPDLNLTLSRPALAIKNYLGQLRIYSYADLVLLLLALSAGGQALVQCSLLWFGFLVFLEYQHRDRGRARWPWVAWAAPWAAAIVIDPSPLLAVFFALSFGYTQKKALPRLACFSPVINGALKGALVCLVPGVTAGQVLAVTVVMATRNLAGDFRDVEKDRGENVATIPVRLGLAHDTRWLYPVALAATSTLWTVAGGLPWWALLTALIVQGGTYRWTPR